MDASELIEKIKTFGLSEYEMAKRLGSDVSQSTINRIATGKSANPSYRVWRALESLYLDLLRARTVKRSSPRAAA